MKQPIFLSAGPEKRSIGGHGAVKRSQGASLFWWTILITLMMGAATFSWFFSIMVFQHPEKPLNYKILAKVNKIPPLRKFSSYTVPNGQAKSARELLTAFYNFNSDQIGVANDMMMRSYLRNYEKEDPPVYVTGQFQVLSARPLTADDLFQEGWVLRARAADIEDVDLEILLPGHKAKNAPFDTDDMITLDKRHTFAALLRVDRPDSERLCGVVVPLVYGGLKDASGESVTCTPPSKLNMESAGTLTEDPGITARIAAGMP
jgi:hypothetical protein